MDWSPIRWHWRFSRTSGKLDDIINCRTGWSRRDSSQHTDLFIIKKTRFLFLLPLHRLSLFLYSLFFLLVSQSLVLFQRKVKQSVLWTTGSRSRSGKSWLEETQCWWWQEQWDVISRSVPFDYWWFFLVLCHFFFFLFVISVWKKERTRETYSFTHSFIFSISLSLSRFRWCLVKGSYFLSSVFWSDLISMWFFVACRVLL